MSTPTKTTSPHPAAEQKSIMRPAQAGGKRGPAVVEPTEAAKAALSPSSKGPETKKKEAAMPKVCVLVLTWAAALFCTAAILHGPRAMKFIARPFVSLTARASPCVSCTQALTPPVPQVPAPSGAAPIVGDEPEAEQDTASDESVCTAYLEFTQPKSATGKRFHIARQEIVKIE